MISKYNQSNFDLLKNLTVVRSHLSTAFRLMKLAEAQAIAKGFAKLSLIVFEQNVKAKQLYERLGYREIAREVIVPHPLIHYSGDAILILIDSGISAYIW